MPILSSGDTKIDFTDDGQGENIVLIHGSVSGNSQWKLLIQDLREKFRVLAPNLYGYGETTPWRVNGTQRIEDHAALIRAICDTIEGPIRLVGHCFGGTVALKVAFDLKERITHLVLYEPNYMTILKMGGRVEAFAEAIALYNDVKTMGGQSNWLALGERFTDYVFGEGSWAAMPPERQDGFAKRLMPLYYEWDCMESEEPNLQTVSRISAKTVLMYSANTQMVFREIVELLQRACPHWSVVTIPDGGHMAPVIRPELVNPVLKQFLVALPSR